MADETKELKTVDLIGVDLMSAGTRVKGKGSPEGGEVFTEARLEKIAADSNAVVNEAKPPNKIGHSFKQALAKASGLTDGEMPALGYLRNFRVEDGKLKGDALRVPEKFNGLLKVGAFRTRSVEISPFESQETGEKFPAVVRGLAWLGAQAPAFRTLDDIYALYAGDEREPIAALFAEDEALDEPDVIAVDFASGDVVWDPETGANDVMSDINALLNPGPSNGFSRYWTSDVALTPDGGKALVCDSSEPGPSTYWIIPFTWDDDHEPVLSAPTDWIMAQQAWVETSQSAASALRDVYAAHETTESETKETTVPEPVEVPGASADTSRQMAEITLNEDTLKAVAEKLGVDVASLDSAEKVSDAIKAFAEAKPEDETTKVVTVPEGYKLMAEDEIERLRSTASDVDVIKTRLFEQDRDHAIVSALREGKIDPAKKDDWIKRFEADAESTKAILELLEPQEKFKTYGADGGGNVEPEVDAMDERQYEEFCALTGIPYDGRGARQEA